MYIEWNSGNSVECGYNRYTNADLGCKVTIHDVDVDKIRTSIFNCSDGLAK
jgi:hypothetical protein